MFPPCHERGAFFHILISIVQPRGVNVFFLSGLVYKNCKYLGTSLASGGGGEGVGWKQWGLKSAQ